MVDAGHYNDVLDGENFALNLLRVCIRLPAAGGRSQVARVRLYGLIRSGAGSRVLARGSDRRVYIRWSRSSQCLGRELEGR